MRRTSLLALCFTGGAVAALFLFAFSARAVTVGPVRLEFSPNPGEIIQGQMFVQNEGSETQTFYPSFERFTEIGGQKVFLKDTTNDLPSWMEIISSSTIPGGQSRTIPFTIRVPQNASPGGHYAVIWWSTAPPAGSGNNRVSIATKAGVLLYLRVSGDIREEASVSDFSAENRLIFSLPFSAEINFKNSGDIYLTPGGTVTLENMLGGVQASAQFNQYGYVAMPGADHSFAVTLNPAGIAFGPYKVKLDLVYGEKQTHIVKSFWVFIVPMWLLISVIALIVLVFLIPRAIRRYNAWVVRKASGKQ